MPRGLIPLQWGPPHPVIGAACVRVPLPGMVFLLPLHLTQLNPLLGRSSDLTFSVRFSPTRSAPHTSPSATREVMICHTLRGYLAILSVPLLNLQEDSSCH